MAVPTHEAGCSTQMWATQCPDCGHAVFFFRCSCGSKVYFDLSEPPWNPHGDRCVRYLIRCMRVDGASPNAIWDAIAGRAAKQGQTVPAEVREWVFGRDRNEPTRIRPQEIRPSGEKEVKVEGEIICVDQVNFFRRFNYVDNAVSRAVLGHLGAEPFVEVLLREDPDPKTRQANDFRCFVPQADFARTSLRVHSRALAILTSFRVGDRRIWLAEHLDRPW